MGKHIKNSFMGEYIIDPMKLTFDPFAKNSDKSIKVIFEDKIARTLWMGIKLQHLTSQYFNKDCLNASKIINEKGAPNSPKALEYFLEKHFEIPVSKKFVEEIFPYIAGLKTLEYEVVEAVNK